MVFQIKQVLQKLSSYSHVIIYGTGKYAECIFYAFKKIGLQEKVTHFVVSDIEHIKMRDIEGIPVISLNQLDKIDVNYIILIAVSKQYVNEIEQLLLENGYNNKQYFCITDYELEEDVQDWDIHREFQELYEYMIQWRVCNRVKDLSEDFISNSGEISAVEKKDLCANDRKQIIFIAGLINARISRIAISLKKIGMQVKIFRPFQGMKPYVGEAELVRNEVEIRDCLNITDLLFYLYSENPLAYCIDPPKASNEISKIMLSYREYFGKIVIMSYDILNLSHILKYPQRYYELEKYAIENADGVVWRYFCKDELEKKLGWQYQGKSMLFLDYCKQYNFPQKHKTENRLKLCCLPTHVKPFLQKISQTSLSTREATVWEIMNKIGNRNDCEFHVYFWTADDDDLRILEKIKQQYANFNYYIHIDHEELMSQIAQYDYGCDIFIEGTVPQYPQTIGVGLEHYLSEGVYIYASQNKYYDFLSADLPIVAIYPKKLCEVLSHYGVIIDMSLETLDIDYLKKNKEMYYQYAQKAHHELSIDKHIHELVNFLEKDLYECV